MKITILAQKKSMFADWISQKGMCSAGKILETLQSKVYLDIILRYKYVKLKMLYLRELGVVLTIIFFGGNSTI